MAKQISAIKFIGTMGNMVGSKGLDGKVILREKAASVTNPQTQGQMDQRARFKLASQVSGMMDAVAKTALKANGIKDTRRGTTNKELMKFINVDNAGVAILNHEFNLVKHPKQTANALTAAVTFNGNLVQGTLTGVQSSELVAKALLVYDHRDNQWKSTSVLDTNSGISLGVSNAQTDSSQLDVYFYAIVVTPSTAEGRARLNNLISQDADGNYKINPNRLDSSNYDYTRMLVASSVRGVAAGDNEPADPAAAERQRNAAIAEFLTKINAPMKPQTTIGLREYASDNNMSIDEAFVALNKENVSGTIDSLELDYENTKVSNGTVTPVSLGEPDLSTPLKVGVPIDSSNLDTEVNSADDIVHLVVLARADDHHGYDARWATGKREDTSVEVTVPSFWQGYFVEIYVFVEGAENSPKPGECSQTLYCGAGRIA